MRAGARGLLATVQGERSSSEKCILWGGAGGWLSFLPGLGEILPAQRERRWGREEGIYLAWTLVMAVQVEGSMGTGGLFIYFYF